MLQFSLLVVSPVQTPPLDSGVTTALEVVRDPVPQGVEQAVQAAHSLQTQLLAHPKVLQASVLVGAAEQEPPLLAGEERSLVAVMVPPPQATVQAPQGPQSPQVQSTGQA